MLSGLNWRSFLLISLSHSHMDGDSNLLLLLLGCMCCISLCKLQQRLFTLPVLCTWQLLLMYISRGEELPLVDTQGLSEGWWQSVANKQLL